MNLEKVIKVAIKEVVAELEESEITAEVIADYWRDEAVNKAIEEDNPDAMEDIYLSSYDFEDWLYPFLKKNSWKEISPQLQKEILKAQSIIGL